jgi:hypothetical protein
MHRSTWRLTKARVLRISRYDSTHFSRPPLVASFCIMACKRFSTGGANIICSVMSFVSAGSRRSGSVNGNVCCTIMRLNSLASFSSAIPSSPLSKVVVGSPGSHENFQSDHMHCYKDYYTASLTSEVKERMRTCTVGFQQSNGFGEPVAASFTDSILPDYSFGSF